jgi:predicted porin
VTAQLTDKLRLELDYTYAAGNTSTEIVGAGGGIFPTVKSEMSSFKADLAYGFSEQTDVVVSWWYETLDTSDWAFVPEPATMPTVLALGVDPYNYDVNYVTLSLRHRFGGAKPAEAEEAAEE